MLIYHFTRFPRLTFKSLRSFSENLDGSSDKRNIGLSVSNQAEFNLSIFKINRLSNELVSTLGLSLQSFSSFAAKSFEAQKVNYQNLRPAPEPPI